MESVEHLNKLHRLKYGNVSNTRKETAPERQPSWIFVFLHLILRAGAEFFNIKLYVLNRGVCYVSKE